MVLFFNHIRRLIAIITIAIALAVPCSAQRLQENDTIQVHTPPKIYFNNDTIKLQDSIHYETSSNNFWRDYIDSRKTNIGKTISRLVITPPKEKITIDPTVNIARRFDEHKGKRISKIDVKVLPPYGAKVYDTITPEYKSMAWYKKLINATHFKTSKRLITRQLTTKVGSYVDPFTLVQEEISLKSMKNIDDVLIILYQDPDEENAVIMQVICKDDFSWTGAVESDFIHSFQGEVSNSNMFGLGQYMEYSFKYDAEKWKRCGNIFRFEYPNIVGTHINSSIYYRNDDKDKLLTIHFERPFLTNTTKWAGGIGFERVYYSYNLPDKRVEWADAKFNYRYEDLWAGHTILLNEKHRFNRTIHLTGRIYGTDMRNATDTINMEQIHFYKDRLNLLLSIQFTSLKYYKGLQIFDLGRSEFVPTGFNIGITGGYEWCAINPSGYIEFFGNYSFFNDETERYYGASLTVGSFVNTLNGFNRGMLNVTATHISNPQTIGDFTCRIYANTTYTLGFNRYPQEQLFITDNEIRGFKADSLFGNKKLGLSIGATSFSPRLKYDFRVAVGAFVDMGVIAEKEKSIFKSKSYFGLGVQLNVQNNNFLIKNLSIRLAYYPRVPSAGESRDYSALISSWSKNGFHEYKVEKPQMSVFK